MIDTPSKSRATTSEWLIAAVISANLIWTTLCLGGYRPETMVWTWLLTAFAGAVYFGGALFSTQRTHPASWFVLPFLFYGALNVVFVSPVPWLGWRDWLGWLHIAVVLWLILNGARNSGPRRLILGTVVALGVVAVILACYQRFVWPDFLMMGRTQVAQFFGRSSGPFGIPNSLAAFLLLLIPPFAALTLEKHSSAFRRILCGYFLLVFLFGLGLTISRGAWLSLLIVAALWPLSIRGKSIEWRAGVSVAVFTLIVIAGAVVYTTVPKVKERFDQLASDVGERSRPIMWRGAWRLFEDSPLVGTGAGSFNVLFERYRPVGFRDEPQWAHNDFLNTLSDYGLIGFALSFGAGGAVVLLARKKFAGRLARDDGMLAGESFDSIELTRAIELGLVAFFLSLFVDFHLKIPALGMFVAIAVAECLLRTWPLPDSPEQSVASKGFNFVALLALCLIVLGIALPFYRGEASRYAARGMIDKLAAKSNPTLNEQRDTLTAASALLADATALDGSNGQSFADAAYVSALWARISPSQANELGKRSEELAREALSLSEAVPEFWVRLGVALDLQGKWGEGSAAFSRAITLAPTNSTMWFYQAYHLSLTPATRPLAAAAVNEALRLDPGHSAAMRLQQSLSQPR
ncbi:MAG TPA: O-antigen ligase family protein [Opitutaceae bacterium]|nr:O-antigen ligase family protein [Opitutaceae bacterium]